MNKFKQGDRVWYHWYQWKNDAVNFRYSGWALVKSEATITKIVCEGVYEISTDKIIYKNHPYLKEEGKQHGILTQLTEITLI